MIDEQLEKIASLFEGDSQAILYALFRKNIRSFDFNTLKKCGFRDNKIIRSKPDPTEHVLFAQTEFHTQTAYEGYTLIFKNHSRQFIIERNDLTDAQAAAVNTIRDKEVEIDDLDLLYRAFLFDFEMKNEHDAKETKKELEKARTDLVKLKEDFAF